MSRNEISLFDLFTMVRKHLLLFCVAGVAIFALVAVATFFLPRKYRSEAQLQLKLGKENLGLDPATGLAKQASVSIAQSPDQEINTIANVLKSRHLAELVVAEVGADKILDFEKPGMMDSVFTSNPEISKGLNPYYTLTRDEQAVWLVQDKVKIRPVKESNSIKIHMDSKHQEQAQLVVQAFVKKYKEEHQRIHIDSSSALALNKAAEKCRSDWSDKQKELVDFRKKTGLVAVEEQRKALVTQIADTEVKLIDAMAALKSAESEFEDLATSLGKIKAVIVKEKTEGAGTVATSQMRSQLFSLEIAEKKLLQDYDESHYKVKNIREQIRDVKRVLDGEEKQREEIVQGPSTVHMETSSKLIEKSSAVAGSQERVAQLKESLEILQGKLFELNENEVKIDRLVADIGVLKSNYEKFRLEADKAKRLDDAAAGTSNIRVVPASLDPFPVFPIIPLNLAIGVILAGLGGLACTLWGERRQTQKLERRAQRLANAEVGEESSTQTVPAESGDATSNEFGETDAEAAETVPRVPR